MVEHLFKPQYEVSMALKQLLFLTYAILMVVYVTVFLQIWKNGFRKQKINPKPSQSKDTKYILLWNSYWNSNDWWLHFEIHDNYFERIKCPETRCELVPVHRRDYRKIEEYDAIVFHGPELKPFEEESLPKVRLPRQVYVYACQESPRSYWNNTVDYKNFFNYTSISN